MRENLDTTCDLMNFLDEFPENIRPEHPRERRKFLLQDLLNLEIVLRSFKWGVCGGSCEGSRGE